jgi:integrase
MNVIAIRPAGRTKPAPRTIHLDATAIKRLAAPAKGNVIYWDDAVAGLGLRITAGGSRAFVYNYRVKSSGQQRRMTIGRFPTWSTGAARSEAERLERLVDGGGDPRRDVEVERQAPTMADLCDRFEREHVVRKRPATAESYKRALKLHIRPFFGTFRKISDIRFADIDKLHQKVTAAHTPYIANRCVSILSKMFSLAAKWQMRAPADGNPCRGIERNPETGRKRYLAGTELARLMAALAACSDQQFANVIRMLLLTGARRGEVLGMKWGDIDPDTGVWTKLASGTKQKRDHVVPLSAAARLLLTDIHTRNSVFVFPGDGKTGHLVEVKKGWATLLKAAGITGLRLHDLRHSFASHLVSGGASLEFIGALLGHSNPATTARYSHLFVDPQRAAVDKVGAIINGAERGPGS